MSDTLRALLQRYRDGLPVRVLAQELGVPFDWVAQRVIAAGVRRDRSRRATRQPPVELESDGWLATQLAGGAGVRDISRHLGVSRAAARRAVRRYVATRTADAELAGPSDPELRFSVATARVERATRALEQARRMQASAIVELQQAGLTNAAIADRLGIDDHAIETMAADDEEPTDV